MPRLRASVEEGTPPAAAVPATPAGEPIDSTVAVADEAAAVADEAAAPVAGDEPINAAPSDHMALLAYNAQHTQHDGPMNENAGRVEACVRELQRVGLWSQCELVTPESDRSSSLVARGEELARLLHTAAHLADISAECASAGATDRIWFCSVCTLQNEAGAGECIMCGTQRRIAGTAGDAGAYVIPEAKTDAYLCPKSLETALVNCALAVEVARRLCDDHGHSGGFALARPPGHHASSEKWGSYCLLNTVAIVARRLLDERKASRILIIDWDVHHGDGTQALMDSDHVLRSGCAFVSVHRHDKDFWPCSGNVGEAGRRDGTLINVPLRGSGFGDADYYAVWEEIVLPLARRYSPDAILVSAGYDCAAGDPIGRFSVSSAGFFWLTRLTLGLLPSARPREPAAHGKESDRNDTVVAAGTEGEGEGDGEGGGVLFVLEGGYDVGEARPGVAPHSPLASGVTATVEGLLAGAAGVDSLPVGWRANVRPETRDVNDEVKGL